METIYYVYRKTDGRYMGHGITFFDDAVHGSTTEPVPDMEESQTATWDGERWVIV